MRPEHSAIASGGRLDLLRRVDSYINLRLKSLSIFYPTQKCGEHKHWGEFAR